MGLMKTHLYQFHQMYGHLIDFAGFKMPVWYEGIIPEHLSVRDSVGIFDVSHMGRCLVEGKDAAIFLNYVITRDVASSSINQGRYTLMCNENGGIIDDAVVFRLEKERFLMIYNASNREKNYAWISNAIEDFQVKIKDISNEVVMLALQGPKAVSTLQLISDTQLDDLRYYWGNWMVLDGLRVFVTRTGYTGEDGFEIFLWDTPLTKPERAEKLWNSILNAGKKNDIKPCGLGARDTLRLEAGMCLYGNDMNEETTPLEANLNWVLQFEKDDFIGKEALLKQKAEGVKKILVGIQALERGVPRPGSKILHKGEEIGKLTSGTFSPLLEHGIGMGYVSQDFAEVGTPVDIMVRKTTIHGKVTKTPFYDVTKYGRKRQID